MKLANEAYIFCFIIISISMSYFFVFHSESFMHNLASYLLQRKTLLYQMIKQEKSLPDCSIIYQVMMFWSSAWTFWWPKMIEKKGFWCPCRGYFMMSMIVYSIKFLFQIEIFKSCDIFSDSWKRCVVPFSPFFFFFFHFILWRPLWPQQFIIKSESTWTQHVFSADFGKKLLTVVCQIL